MAAVLAWGRADWPGLERLDVVMAGPDFNGDGHADVIARKPYGTLWLYEGDGAGGWRGSSQIGTNWTMFDKVMTLGQAQAVVNVMEWMASTSLPLGRQVGGTNERYWPVPPLGVFYRVTGDDPRVVEIVDQRRRDIRQP